MDFNTKTITVHSKKYGDLNVNLSRQSKFGNVYFVCAFYKNKKLFGLVTEDGTEIIPISSIFLTAIQFFNNGKDMLLEFKHNRHKVPEYYHIKNYDDGTSKIVFKTDYKSEVPVTIGLFEETDDYWLIELGTKVDKKVAIYDYKNTKIISNYLDEIRYQDDSIDHQFFYSISIESSVDTPDGQKVPYTHSKLYGFLDEKGNLSSQIYDAGSNMLYSSYMYGPNTLSPRFNELIENLTKGYIKLYYEKEDHIDEVISYLYENANMSEKPKDFKDGEKVLDFNRRKKG